MCVRVSFKGLGYVCVDWVGGHPPPHASTCCPFPGLSSPSSLHQFFLLTHRCA